MLVLGSYIEVVTLKKIKRNLQNTRFFDKKLQSFHSFNIQGVAVPIVLFRIKTRSFRGNH